MPDGFSYSGEWRDGEIHGEGVATYSSGDVYEGSFEDGRRHGFGTLRYASGEEQSGIWEGGALVDPDGDAARDEIPQETPETPEADDPEANDPEAATD